MNVASKLLPLAAILVALNFPAKAAIVQYAIGGNVLGGYDSTDAFGGGDLTGKSFVAIATFDTSNAVSSYASPAGSGANGGLNANGMSFIRVDLMLNGFTRSFSDYTSNVSVDAGRQFNVFVQSSSGANKNDVGFYIASSQISADYTKQADLSGLSDLYAGYYTLSDAGSRQVVWANFEVTSLASVSIVPLPSTAPMFGTALFALGAIGFGLRRLRGAVL